MIDTLAGVLYYSSRGHNRPCGQSVGANGSGNFVKLYFGDKDLARDKAYLQIRELEKQGHHLTFADYVESDSYGSYYGNPVSYEVVT